MLLLLDEPTSGLDPATSLQLLRALKSLAKDNNVTIVAVIHAPRKEIVDLFDNMLLLSTKGETVYFGASNAIDAYFARLGFSVPPQTNPADYFIDLIAQDGQESAASAAAAAAEHGVRMAQSTDSDILNEDLDLHTKWLLFQESSTTANQGSTSTNTASGADVLTTIQARQRTLERHKMRALGNRSEFLYAFLSTAFVPWLIWLFVFANNDENQARSESGGGGAREKAAMLKSNTLMSRFGAIFGCTTSIFAASIFCIAESRAILHTYDLSVSFSVFFAVLLAFSVANFALTIAQYYWRGKRAAPRQAVFQLFFLAGFISSPFILAPLLYYALRASASRQATSIFASQRIRAAIACGALTSLFYIGGYWFIFLEV